MAKSRRRPRHTHGGRLACPRGHQRATGGPRHPRCEERRSLVAHAAALGTGLPVVALPSFIDDARGLLTELQIDRLKRHVLREVGAVRYEHCATLRVREVRFEGFWVLVLDQWIAGEVQLAGLKPLADDDGPHSPTGKTRTAIRRTLRKVGTILGYEIAKRLLRDLLGYDRHSTALVALRKDQPKLLTSCRGKEKLEESFGQQTPPSRDAVRDFFLVVAKVQHLDVLEIWCLRTSKQHLTRGHALERAKLSFDYLVEEQPFITDLFSEQCFSGKQTLGKPRLNADLRNLRELDA